MRVGWTKEQKRVGDGTRTRAVGAGSREAVGVGQQRGEKGELVWNHGQGQSAPDSGDQWQTRWGPVKKIDSRCLYSRCLWNFR